MCEKKKMCFLPSAQKRVLSKLSHITEESKLVKTKQKGMNILQVTGKL
jgi:hypothetical protein